MARRSKKLMTETEFNQLLQQRTAQAAPKRQSSRRSRVVEPDYDNMELAEFSGHVQATSQECMELGIGSGFKAARAFERGNYIEGTVKTCEAVVGVASVIAIIAQLFGAASGRD